MMHFDFHRLIEIAINLDKHLDANRRFPNPKSNDSIKKLQKAMKEWIKKNYNDPGINRRGNNDLEEK